MKQFFIHIRNFFIKRFEMIYVFELDTVLIDEEKKRSEEGVRIDVLNKISLDLFKKGKKIQMVDIWQDTKAYVTHYTVGSAKPTDYQKIIPLLYEIYAYKKIKKTDVFTYPFEKCIFKIFGKEINILKFKV